MCYMSVTVCYNTRNVSHETLSINICQERRENIMDKDNTTTRSFRITEATADKIKDIAAEIGGNQQQTLAKLIEAYELQKGKTVLADKRTDIETFDNYVTALTRMYMTALENGQNASNIVRAEFEAQLKSKDSYIQDLQEQTTQAKQAEQEATTIAEGLKEENTRLNNYVASLKSEYEAKTKDLQDMLKDKDKLNEARKEAIEQQKRELTEMKEKSKQVEILNTELEKCRTDLSTAIKDKEQLLIQHEKDMLELEKKLQAEKATEIEKYQTLYFSLLQEQKQDKQEQEDKPEPKQEQEQPKKRGRRKATAAEAEKTEE